MRVLSVARVRVRSVRVGVVDRLGVVARELPRVAASVRRVRVPSVAGVAVRLRVVPTLEPRVASRGASFVTRVRDEPRALLGVLIVPFRREP